MTKSELYKNLLNELNHSLVIKPKDLSYWLSNYKTLPIPAVEYFYNSIKQSNQDVDRTIEAGIEANAPIVAKLNLKMKSIKKNYYKAAEAQEVANENSDESLNTLLKDL